MKNGVKMVSNIKKTFSEIVKTVDFTSFLGW